MRFLGDSFEHGPFNQPPKVDIGRSRLEAAVARYRESWAGLIARERISSTPPPDTEHITNLGTEPLSDMYVLMCGLREQGFDITLVDNATDVSGEQLEGTWAQYAPQSQAEEALAVSMAWATARSRNDLVRFFSAMLSGHAELFGPHATRFAGLEDPQFSLPENLVERGFVTSLVIREVLREHYDHPVRARDHDYSLYGTLVAPDPPAEAILPFDVEQIMGIGSTMVALAQREISG
jgi:hypothetical protein